MLKMNLRFTLVARRREMILDVYMRSGSAFTRSHSQFRALSPSSSALQAEADRVQRQQKASIHSERFPHLSTWARMCVYVNDDDLICSAQQFQASLPA